MEITHYTTKDIMHMAKELNLTLRDSALPYTSGQERESFVKNWI
ncbi:hypothetical protein Xvie_03605 [Xenorhabdus vietnamensis]|uniref:Uncharacterized protein n=1 Tax=Xenorhabdus vietnamensis TaxID=351656 RepID=A0A1Y2S777_9GAMM|nr:hypothetical protein Xvie_03605 [Xenorhabdus vietnamensis]